MQEFIFQNNIKNEYRSRISERIKLYFTSKRHDWGIKFWKIFIVVLSTSSIFRSPASPCIHPPHLALPRVLRLDEINHARRIVPQAAAASVLCFSTFSSSMWYPTSNTKFLWFITPVYPEICHDFRDFSSTAWTSEKDERNFYCRLILEPGTLNDARGPGKFGHYRAVQIRSA